MSQRQTFSVIGMLALLLAPGSGESADARPNAADQSSACSGHEVAVSVLVRNVRDQRGVVRVQVYGHDPERFLARGGTIRRIQVPSNKGETELCVPLSEPGTYALTVIHDRNADGRPNRLREGFGFSRNPRLLFSPPTYEEVRIDVPDGTSRVEVKLRYAF